MSHCLHHKLEHLITQKTGFMNTILTFTASVLSSHSLESLPFLQNSSSVWWCSVNGKMMKRKILAHAKITQHKQSDILLQYQSSIFTQPKNLLPYSHHPASLPDSKLQKFNPHSHIIIFKYPTSIFSPTSKFFL